MQRAVKRLRSLARRQLHGLAVRRQWLRERRLHAEWTRLGNAIAITCGGRGDGAGAQAHAVLSVQALAHDLGLTYRHTPFRQMEHNYAADPAYAARWESFFNFGQGHALPDRHGLLLPMGVSLHQLPRRPDSPLVFPEAHFHADTPWNKHRYLGIRPQVRQRFHAAPDRRPFWPPHVEGPRIAVHVRRGDVGSSHNSFRFTPNGRIVRGIEAILAALPTGHPTILVCSQGRQSDFPEFAKLRADVRWLLDASPFDTMEALTGSDILLMSKSSFSFVAGFLSRGVVIYDPFWHQPLADWIRLDEHGQLPRWAAPRLRAINGGALALSR